ncbi:uncharacterized protein C8Q71DRAFT_854361 [Rhodofomes roseus]|uniref:Uncharacterized protein n=1 Tax=Rhodofomes roseus TaxID=34475 RepID=A0ABQ8KUP3_9APHY|nr:uncharacterized protein C8Q71DRAFT_854361 [Rhodofomes roseus]KAH9842007.1 hypothetical protein C8Q71DRAFT_854361 [Rhodofomes roseus]
MSGKIHDDLLSVPRRAFSGMSLSAPTSQNQGTSTARTSGAPTRATPHLHSSATPLGLTGSMCDPTPANCSARRFGSHASWMKYRLLSTGGRSLNVDLEDDLAHVPLAGENV